MMPGIHNGATTRSYHQPRLNILLDMHVPGVFSSSNTMANLVTVATGWLCAIYQIYQHDLTAQNCEYKVLWYSRTSGYERIQT